ncbi:MAG TPA: hypothetical protein VMS98_06545 [Thermoanaerobaculia bacterium]|nr:hypothetical protein [Thermoanaerobaculia bacterium]
MNTLQVTTWLDEFGRRVAAITVDTLIFLAVVFAAALLGWLTKKILSRVLRASGFDSLAGRSGATTSARRAGLSAPPSDYASRFAGWVVFFVVLIAGASSMHIPAADLVLQRALLFIPAFVTAVVLLIIGVLFSEFAARGVLIASVNAGWRGASAASALVRLLVLTLAVAMALDQLAVARSIVVAAFSIVVGGVVLALAIAFGLGGRHIARDYLRSHLAPPPANEPGAEIDHR